MELLEMSEGWSLRESGELYVSQVVEVHVFKRSDGWTREKANEIREVLGWVNAAIDAERRKNPVFLQRYVTPASDVRLKMQKTGGQPIPTSGGK